MVVADFHLGDRGVGMETDAHPLQRFGSALKGGPPPAGRFPIVGACLQAIRQFGDARQSHRLQAGSYNQSSFVRFDSLGVQRSALSVES